MELEVAGDDIAENSWMKEERSRDEERGGVDVRSRYDVHLRLLLGLDESGLTTGAGLSELRNRVFVEVLDVE